MLRRFRTSIRPPATEAGFLLPLSLSAALMLLLSSLSLSAAALQAHQQQGAERARQQSQDQLASAAHQLAANLQGAYRCLLPIPSDKWRMALQTTACPGGLDLPQMLLDSPVLLRQWQPDGSGDSGELWLQLGENGLQKRYYLNLLPGHGLREVG